MDPYGKGCIRQTQGIGEDMGRVTMALQPGLERQGHIFQQIKTAA
jgi:hypothetical protein